MNLLFVSNLYPPHHLGGYEMLCHEVATQLEDRGHQITVLTSTYGVNGDEGEDRIYRRLKLESDFHYYHPLQLLQYRADRRANRREIRECISRVAPDVVMIWGMWNLSRLIPLWIEEIIRSRTVYYLADHWPSMPSAHKLYWEEPVDSWKGRLFKQLLATPARWLVHGEWEPISLRLDNVMVCSNALKNQLIENGINLQHAKVVYHGIDPAPYREAFAARQPHTSADGLRVAFVGTLAPHKGAHTVIEALSYLKRTESASPVTLSILGAGHPDYEARLRELVYAQSLSNNVTFHTPIPRAELPRFLTQHDVLVMPSIYEEPQARISQEAMAAGLVLVATLTGGTKEILEDEKNGLAFAPEDAQGLALQLKRLTEDAQLLQRLRSAAWKTVSERFTITHMIDDLESFIKTAVVHRDAL